MSKLVAFLEKTELKSYKMPLKEGVLWIGGLADYMTEKFLKDGFASLGETDVERIEIVRNKFTGRPAGYGLVYFDTDASALMAMHKLNNKTVPNSQPPIRSGSDSEPRTSLYPHPHPLSLMLKLPT